ncbi:hypothetical protein Cs7R123_39850 [Catellatospora sp. TT07R-123]|nr:hypothetical protein Cs7R123_39850 [Catellatospora sp. TT07R-123]
MDALSAEFETFVRHRAPSLLRAAYLLTGDQYLAEDLVQVALARTHLAWRRLHDRGNAEAYTRKVMYHQQISWWRRRRGVEVPTETMPVRATVPDHAADAALKITLRAALQRLSDKQRAVLVLRFFEDRTEAETAECLGVTVGTVKSQTSKALARLRTLAPELADLAGDARPVDLAERAVRTSGRMRARRAIATSIGAAAAVVAIVAVVLAALPWRRPAPDPAVSVSPSASASAAPQVSVAPSSAPSARPPAAEIGGSMYWFAFSGGANRLLALTGGQVRELRSLGPDDPCVGNSLRMSPDGATVAWVRGEDLLGELVVGGTTGGPVRALATDVMCAGLVWSRDGSKLFVQSGAGPGVVAVSSGRFTPMEQQAWEQARGRELGGYVGTVGRRQLTVTRADGTEPRTVAYTPPNDGDSQVVSVSADGRYAAVGFPHGDPNTSPEVYAVIDMTTGQQVRFPMAGVDLVYFQPDGTVLAASGARHRIYRLAADFSVLAEASLPTGVSANVMFQYLP